LVRGSKDPRYKIQAKKNKKTKNEEVKISNNNPATGGVII